MKPEVREAWREALLSGQYKQGVAALSFKGLNGSYTYCCLGVLCELALQQCVPLVKTERQAGSGAFIAYDGEESYLPVAVQEWAGLPQHPRNAAGDESLSVLNDTLLDFDQIAGVLP